jgi:glyoxylase-like metal-dependent hydrolase (beta-lactamase superfamily II)
MLSLKVEMPSFRTTVHPVVIHGGNELILCDAGYPRQVNELEAALRLHGFSIKDLTRIIVTHHDHDHVGSLAALKALNPRAEVIAGALEADYVEGAQKSLRLIQAEELNARLSGEDRQRGDAFAEYLRTIVPCAVDRRIPDFDHLLMDDLRVVPTPGHTPGHISLFIESSKVLISGDALALEGGRLTIPNPQFTLDLRASVESAARLKRLGPETVVCYHGGSLKGDVGANLDALLAAYAPGLELPLERLGR